MDIKSKISNRSLKIDAIRGMSIVAVILFHIQMHFPIANNIATLSSISYKFIFLSGYYAVCIFFVVSGFLITMRSLDKWESLPKIKLKDFYQQRAIRILPLLTIVIIILSALDRLNIENFNLTNVSLTNAIFAAFTFHINYLEAKFGYLPGAWDVMWSLSIEEVFYLLFPVICIGLRRSRYIVCFLVILILIGPFARTSITSSDIWQDHSYLSCMDGIALGCIAALIRKKVYLSESLQKYLGNTGIVLVIIVLIFRAQLYAVGLTKIGLNVTILEIGIALYLMNYKEGLYKKTSGLSIKTLTKIGKYSYETYLTHMIVLMVAINILTEYTIQLNIIILYALLIFIMVIAAWVFSLVSSQMVLAVKWTQKVLRHINAADKE